MSYWLLPVCIIMAVFVIPFAKWVFVNYYCKTVPEPDFMEMDQEDGRRSTIVDDNRLGQIKDIRA